MSCSFVCVYQCLDCQKYWIVGPGSMMRCTYCNSKEREQKSSVDPHVMLRRLLNEDSETVINELKGLEE